MCHNNSHTFQCHSVTYCFDTYINIHIYIFTNIHTYIHAYIHAFTYIYPSIQRHVSSASSNDEGIPTISTINNHTAGSGCTPLRVFLLQVLRSLQPSGEEEDDGSDDHTYKMHISMYLCIIIVFIFLICTI